MCMVPKTVELDEDRSRESRPGPGDEEKIWFTAGLQYVAI